MSSQKVKVEIDDAYGVGFGFVFGGLMAVALAALISVLSVRFFLGGAIDEGFSEAGHLTCSVGGEPSFDGRVSRAEHRGDNHVRFKTGDGAVVYDITDASCVMTRKKP